MNLKTLLIMAGVTFSPAILLGQNASAQSDTLKTVNRLKEVVVRGYGAERNLKAPEMNCTPKVRHKTFGVHYV